MNLLWKTPLFIRATDDAKDVENRFLDFLEEDVKMLTMSLLLTLLGIYISYILLTFAIMGFARR